ncbi:MAG: allantoate amidohydrolase [Microbacteriaceae bacterium]|nr:allantoate amidohydrolase [Microbacteriaceae bacterium]
MTVPVAHGVLAGLDEVAGIGRDARRGGYSRHFGDAADRDMRDWFVARAIAAGLDVEVDANGNIWAWWGAPTDGAVVTGSHLDSVPGGGAYDGPLGVVSALDAVARMQASGFAPSRPFAILVFAEEEGSRFGVACLGSRLMTGAIDADAARSLRDADGVSFAEAAASVGLDPARLGVDRRSLARIGLFVELHVEQGRGLIDLGAPVAVASSVLAHGRWRLTFDGQGNHAGTTLMADRDDPMIAASAAVLAVREVAASLSGARATVGRVEVVPGGTNVISSRVTLWLDARAETDAATRDLVDRIAANAGASSFAEESWSGRVDFDHDLRMRLADSLGGVPVLATGAGHDAGVLAGSVPTAMLFVRNPTGVSHSPEEFAELDDCVAGVEALETVLRGLL